MGYDMRWEAGRKSITYTTPDGQKCRCNKLHDEKYWKENMEEHFGQRQVEGFEPTRKLAEELPPGSSAIRDTAGHAEEFAGDAHGNREAAKSDAGTNRPAAKLGAFAGGDYPGHRKDTGVPERSTPKWTVGHRKCNEHSVPGTTADTFADDYDRSEAFGTATTHAGFYSAENQVDVLSSWDSTPADIMGLAVGLANLVVQPAEQEPPAHPPPRKQQRQKRGHDMLL